MPHTYDYVLHSFGRVEPEKPDAFEPTKALMKRYWLVDDQKAMTTGEPWMLDFVIEEKPGARSGFYGREWYEHRAKLRLRMAGEPQTLVVHGVWGNELARLVSEQHKGAKLDQLATVVARRTGQREALFVASHEPYDGYRSAAGYARCHPGSDERSRCHSGRGEGFHRLCRDSIRTAA